MTNRIITSLTLAAAYALPLIAGAADEGFTALSPIPGLNKTNYTDIAAYVNAVFGYVIAIAAILAVIMIMYHGIQYMLQEAVTEKKDHLVGLRAAVFGFVLLLVSWLILYVINPQILQLSALKASLQSGTSYPNSPTPASGSANTSANTSGGSGGGIPDNIIWPPLFPGL